MRAPRHIRKKRNKQKQHESRDLIIASAEKRLPKDKAALYFSQKDAAFYSLIKGNEEKPN